MNNTPLVFSLNSNEANLWLLSYSIRNSTDRAGMCCTTKENSEFGP